MTKESKSGLYDLHSMIVDSREGFAQAAAYAGDAHISGYLQSLSTERDSLAAELGRLLVGMGAEALPGKGTLLGSLHRAWMQLNAGMRARSNAALLAACARGEKSLLLRYDELLAKDGLSLEARQVLQRHRALVKEQAERVEHLLNCSVHSTRGTNKLQQ